MRKIVSPQAVLFLAFWLALLLFMRSKPFNDPGALWHIRVGDLIVESGFPRVDPFTWTYAKTPWIPQQWLAEVAISELHAAGGFDSLLLGMATLVAGFATWLCSRFMRGGLHPVFAFALVAFGVGVAGFHFYIRPHMFTFVFMGLVAAFLIDTECNGVYWPKWFMLAPICALWANLHGGVLGGIVTIGLAIGGWTMLYMFKKNGPINSWSRVLGLGFVVLLCLASLLINPFGMEMLRTWWKIVGSSELPKFISEHQPISLRQPDGLGVFVFGLFYLIMLAGVLPRRPRISWLVPVVWFALACKSIRHGPLFCSVALVAMADFFPDTRWFRWLKTHGDTLIRKSDHTPVPFWRTALIPLICVATAFTLQVRGIRVPVIGANWARLDPRGVPVELVPIVQEYARQRPKGYPVLNDANLGGFLIYFAPTLKVYLDDRCELYGDQGLLEYIDFFVAHPERVEELMKEWHFDRILVSTDTPMEKFLASRPDLVREGARAEKAVWYERVK